MDNRSAQSSKPITIPTLIIIRVQYQFKVCTSVCVILLTLQDYVKTRGFLARIRNFATEILKISYFIPSRLALIRTYNQILDELVMHI